MNKTNLKMIKKLNELKILNLLRDEAPISRSEMAKATKISKVTISEIVSRLDKEGYILTLGKGNSTKKGGKRPTLIKLNPDKGYVIGIEIKRNEVNIAIANIISDIICEFGFEYGNEDSIDFVIVKIFTHIDKKLKNLSIKYDKLISIGIGIPGFVNYELGELSFSNKGWENKPFVAQFVKKYNVPVLIENDANMVAIGEDLLGAGRNESNFICITLESGIGAGIIMDNQLIRGSNGMAGEIGYLKLGYALENPRKYKKLYTDQDRFGSILSEDHLYTVIKSEIEKNSSDLEKPIDEYTIFDFLKLGEEGNEIVTEILDEYGEIIASLCTELIKTINPKLIILTGEVIENSNYLYCKIQEYTKQIMAEIPFDISSIIVGELGIDAACLKGAVTMALHVIFKPYIQHKRLRQIQIKE